MDQEMGRSLLNSRDLPFHVEQISRDLGQHGRFRILLYLPSKAGYESEQILGWKSRAFCLVLTLELFLSKFMTLALQEKESFRSIIERVHER